MISGPTCAHLIISNSIGRSQFPAVFGTYHWLSISHMMCYTDMALMAPLVYYKGSIACHVPVESCP